MTKFIRNNTKKLLALFMVILMVAFILPSGMKSGQSGSQRRLIGYVGSEKVYDTDVSFAKLQWDLLQHNVIIMDNGEPRMSFVDYLRRSNDRTMQILVDQITQHPELFMLLQKEADRMGVLVTPAQAESVLQSGEIQIRLPGREATILPIQDVTDLGYAAEVRDAVAAFLRVKAAEDRASSTIKISEPVLRHTVAGALQEIQVRVAELPAKDFLDKVPAPTTQQLQEQFNQFANYPVDTPPTNDNPHGFGYRYPNRVTLQYIAVPHDLVSKVVRSTKTDYEWDVDARKYYFKNLAEFPSTQPAEPAATKPSDAFSLSTTRPSTSAPTTRPFEDVRATILEKLMTPEIDRKAKDVQDRITNKLLTDWDAFHTAHPAAATTSPSDAGGYASYEYLQQLASEVERQTGVLPTVASIGDYRDAKQLLLINGIGQSTSTTVGPFPQYATNAATDVTAASEKAHASLKLWQPSQLLKDPAESTYVFRITGAKPSAKPDSLAEVAPAVERDWKLARAYELAKEQAKKLVDTARESGSLDTAARNMKVNTLSTGWFGKEPAGGMYSTPIDGLPLTPIQAAVFRNEAFGLLNIAAAAATQPTTGPSTQPAPAMSVVELASDEKLFAVELTGLRHRFPSDAPGATPADVERQMIDFLTANLRAAWFNYDSVVKRTGWKDESADTRAKSASASAAGSGNGR